MLGYDRFMAGKLARRVTGVGRKEPADLARRMTGYRHLADTRCSRCSRILCQPGPALQYPDRSDARLGPACKKSNPIQRATQTAAGLELRKELTPEASVQRTPSQTLSIRSEAVAPVFLRLPMVMRMTGLGRTTIYRLIANQKFPSPVRLGPRAIAWRRSDLDRWSEARPVVAH